MNLVLAHAGLYDITPELGRQIVWILAIIVMSLPASVILLVGVSVHPSVVGLIFFQSVVIVYLMMTIARAFRRRGYSGIGFAARMYAVYPLICLLTNFLGLLGFWLLICWNSPKP